MAEWTDRSSQAGDGKALFRLCGCIIAALGSFYLLFSAQPIHAAELAGEAGAGLATGILVATTIVGEAAAPQLIGRFGRSAAMTAALLSLVATSVLAFMPSIEVVFAALALRGLGLGVLLVAACGLAVRLAPPSRQAETMAVYGFAAAIPAVLFVPMGPWLFDIAGPVITAGLAVVLGLAALLGVTAETRPVAEFAAPRSRGGRLPIWPIALLISGAIVAGVLITFVTLTHRHLPVETLAVALFLHGACAALSRGASGGVLSRHGPRAMTITGVGALLAGCACLASAAGPAVWVGSALAGAAFGLLQNVSLTEMLRGAPASSVDQVSAAWNIAYDVGLGVGGLGFIALAPLGSAAAYLSLAACLSGLLLVAGLVSRRDAPVPLEPSPSAPVRGTIQSHKQES